MNSKGSKITFFSKTKTICPVCTASFHREDLLTGGGRLIAGDINNELRRKYEPSQKFGDIYPLMYPIIVCPVCFYASFATDFDKIGDQIKSQLELNTNHRTATVRSLFDELDFHEPRSLKEGVASYYFAITSYDSFTKDFSPTIKQGIAALRASWLLQDLHKKVPDENYDYISKLFYRKAGFFYKRSLDLEIEGKENISDAGNLGPDTDKNYGYDGVLYLAAYLEFYYGSNLESEIKRKQLESAKRTAAKIFGMGKASKKKPTIILEKAKDLHKLIGEKLKAYE